MSSNLAPEPASISMPGNKSKPLLMSIKNAALESGIPYHRLLKLVHAGLIPVYTIPDIDNVWLVRWDDITAFLEAHKVWAPPKQASKQRFDQRSRFASKRSRPSAEVAASREPSTYSMAEATPPPRKENSTGRKEKPAA